MPEPIIIEKESLDDLNHANHSPCLRTGQSYQPISNNGFQRHCTKLGNAHTSERARARMSASEETITWQRIVLLLVHNRATDAFFKERGSKYSS